MPSRNLPVPAAFDASELTPRGLDNARANCFDKAFSAAVTESWDDWIQWGSTALEQDSPAGDRRDSVASSVSLRDASWAGDNYYAFDDYSPFEMEPQESPAPASSCGSAVPVMRAPLPTYLWEDQDPPSTLRRFPALTPAEEKRLEDIAMPHRRQSSMQPPSSPKPSPAPAPAPAPATLETRTRRGRKKQSASPQAVMTNTLRQSRQRGHNAIEKRYRTNLNEKIDCLRQGIPSLNRTSSAGSTSGDEDLCETRWDGQQKYGKAAVLTRALDYIKHLENTTQRLGGEVESLKVRTGGFEMDVAMNGCVTANALLLPRADTLESIQAGMIFSCGVLSEP